MSVEQNNTHVVLFAERPQVLHMCLKSFSIKDEAFWCACVHCTNSVEGSDSDFQASASGSTPSAAKHTEKGTIKGDY